MFIVESLLVQIRKTLCIWEKGTENIQLLQIIKLITC